KEEKRMRMRTVGLILVTFAVGAGFGIWTEGRGGTASAQSTPAKGFAALPGAIGSQDLTGPYEVAKGWPKDISTLPGNEKWTYGAGQGVFAESPNRIYMLSRGDRPNIKAHKAPMLPQLGPSLSFPIGRLPWRDATVAAMPGA